MTFGTGEQRKGSARKERGGGGIILALLIRCYYLTHNYESKNVIGPSNIFQI